MTPETIAIVEDDAAIRAVLKVALKSAGYSLVCEAERGDEGLRLVCEQKPSLVLLDVMMPGLEGFEVLKRLRDGDCSHFVAGPGKPPLLVLQFRNVYAGVSLF